MANPFANPTAASMPRVSEAAAAYLLASRLNPTYGGGSAAPEGVHYDLDPKPAKACSALLPEFPFAHLGDSQTAIVTQEFIQGSRYFKPTPLGTTKADDARFLLTDEKDFRDLTGGMVRFKREWSMVPQRHNAYESFVHSFQYLSSIRPATLAEKPVKVKSRLFSEFFHVRELSKYSPYLASRFEQWNERLITRRGEGNWSLEGLVFFVTTDKEIVAEDSDILVWKYPIMERRTRLVDGPTLAFWGNAFVIPGISS